MLLQLTDVSKSYAGAGRTVVALDRLSFALDRGDFVAVQGPSGCGKSTMLLTAGTLLRPDGGTIEINGQATAGMSLKQLAALRSECIGFVFQQFHLIPYLSVLDNVLAPALATGKNDLRVRAGSLIERLGLAGRAHHVPSQLSSGERQRCALARALLNQPKLLLADEPTGNLDAENAAVVLGVLREFAESGGGVLLVTHDATAAAAAKSIVKMHAGRIETAPPVVADRSAAR